MKRERVNGEVGDKLDGKVDSEIEITKGIMFINTD